MAEDARSAAVAPALNGVPLGRAPLAVLSALEEGGLEAWVVGGWVRDALLGRPGHDVDVCCSGSWEESAAALRAAGMGVVESGTRFGGITALVRGERIEVTAYRLDGFYADGRHPSTIVRAASVEDDLARRDFTVNAMAWHPERGLLDLYDGQGDLARRQIRAVGEPRRRFEEDALRMLRAVRFSCRLGFEIEPATAQALAACAPLLDAVARERVGQELDEILLSTRGGEALLRAPELMCAAVPELAACRGFDQRSRYHVFDVYGHTAQVLKEAGALERERRAAGAEAEAFRPLAWAALLHDISKPETFTMDTRGHGHFHGHPERGAERARAIMRRLALPRAVIDEACLLIRHHDRPLCASRSDMLGILNALSGEGRDALRLADELFDLKRADTLGKAPFCFSYVGDIEEMRRLAHELAAAGGAYSLKTLALAGGDLVRAGVEPGPRVGEMLERALKAQMAGEVENRTDVLLGWLGLA